MFLAAASAGTLEESLHAVQTDAADAEAATLARVIAATRPPAERTFPLDATEQADLSLRWWAMRDEASCRRFEEMAEALRRSGYHPAPAPGLAPATPSPFGAASHPMESLLDERFRVLTGAPPTWRITPNEWMVWDASPRDWVVDRQHGMVSKSRYCRSALLLTLRDELVTAGVADLPGELGNDPTPGGLTLGDQLDVLPGPPSSSNEPKETQLEQRS